MPYLIIGFVVAGIGVWLIRTPRNSRIGVFLGPMIAYRLLGILFLVLGLFTFLAGAGMRTIGPIPIIVH